MNSSLGNFGLGNANFGSNLSARFGVSNFGAPSGGDTAALLQQLIAQQGGGANGAQAAGVPAPQDGAINPAFGTKRSINEVEGGGEDDGGPAKKQQTVSL